MDHLDISDGALETLSDAAVVQISNEIGMRVPRQGDLRPPPPIRSDDSFGRKIEKGLLISNSMWLIQWWSVGCQESRLADLDMDDCLGKYHIQAKDPRNATDSRKVSALAPVQAEGGTLQQTASGDFFFLSLLTWVRMDSEILPEVEGNTIGNTESFLQACRLYVLAVSTRVCHYRLMHGSGKLTLSFNVAT